MFVLAMQIRGLRLLSFLRQCFTGFKVEGILNHYINTTPEGERHGYEGFRRIHLELSLQCRAEVLSFRENVLKFKTKSHVLQDMIREIDVERNQFAMLLNDWSMPGVDVRLKQAARVWFGSFLVAGLSSNYTISPYGINILHEKG